MIVDSLQAAERYLSLHPGFRPAFEFLRNLAPNIAPGRQELQGERLFAIIAREQGRGRENSLLESHRRYIDIQYVVADSDVIGWLPTALCRRVSSPYAADKDIGFFYDRPTTWLEIPAGHFAIFYPDDAHAPLATAGPIHKAVVKIAVDWE